MRKTAEQIADHVLEKIAARMLRRRRLSPKNRIWDRTRKERNPWVPDADEVYGERAKESNAYGVKAE